MRCAVCYRQARGWGYFNPSGQCIDPRHEQFCSMRCQRVFSQLMEKTEGYMIDPTELERAAMRACLKPLGEAVAALGFERSPARYTRDEALTLIEAVVTAYQDHMVAEHERWVAKERTYFEALKAQREQAAQTGATLR